MMNQFNYKIPLVVFIILILGSCARSFNPDIERGSGYDYNPGTPDVRADAIGFITTEGETRLDVVVQISKSSLIYRSDFERRFAEVEIDILIVDELTSLSQTFQDTIIVDDPNVRIGEGMYLIVKEDFPVNPGNKIVTVTVTDLTSDKKSVREIKTYLFDPENPQTDMTSVRMYGKNSLVDATGFVVISTYDVPAINDSLYFEFLVSNKYDDKPLTVRTRLLKFQSDREPALALSDRQPAPSSLQFVGYRFRNPRVIEESTRLIEQSGSVTMQYFYKTPEMGNYRFEVYIDATDQTDGLELFRARDFSVKSKNYPHILSAREMAAPLVYLMSRNEHRDLMRIENPDSLKKAIDRFWLSNLNANDARAVISQFYERVEQANMFFSSFKEGWQTDMGRVYIMFGPPIAVEPFHNTMVWAYTYNLNDPLYNIRFNRARPPSEFFPFDHYLVQRNSNYFSLEYQQVQRWLQGIMR